MKNLEEVISVERQAVAATPSNHPDLAGRLNNLRDSYENPFQTQGKMKDLEEATSLGRQALRKIGKSIALSAGDTMARGIRLSFQQNSILEDTTMGIVQSMTAEERETTSYEPHEDVTWIEKLEELKRVADGYSLFGGLDEVLELLAPGSGNGGAEEEGDDDVEEV